MAIIRGEKDEMSRRKQICRKKASLKQTKKKKKRKRKGKEKKT